MTSLQLYDLVLSLHVLSALALFSGTAVAAAGAHAARRRGNCGEIAALLELARRGAQVVATATVISAATGIWLVHLGRWGFGTPWVAASIGLFAAATLAGVAGGRRPKGARLLATRLAAQGLPVSAELRGSMCDRVTDALNYLAATVLVGIVVLMLLKPA